LFTRFDEFGVRVRVEGGAETDFVTCEVLWGVRRIGMREKRMGYHELSDSDKSFAETTF